jgi:acetyl-CoA carboxylase carboxyltransferase component
MPSHAAARPIAQDGEVLRAPVTGTVSAIDCAVGQDLHRGQVVLVLESMKMDIPVEAPADGVLMSLNVTVGDVAEQGAELMRWRRWARAESGVAGRTESLAQTRTTANTGRGEDTAEETLSESASSAALSEAVGARAVPDARRPEAEAVHPSLTHLTQRRALLQDAARPEAMSRRHATGLRSARENVAALLDAGSFSEFGAFAVAAQRSRRTDEDLQRNTPADGLITGTGTVHGRPCAVMAYDYTVLAGTQGVWNHAKSDRLLDVARRSRLPLVLFAEGGGGRPGDVDWPGVAGLDCTTFASLAALSGEVPLVGIVAGRCFAGNAALLGCCDLIIAVEGASIGLGGPAMIEGGGLGRVEPDAVGPVDVHWANGVVDVRVPDEAAAVAVAKKWLGLVADRAAGPSKSGLVTSPSGGAQGSAAVPVSLHDPGGVFSGASPAAFGHHQEWLPGGDPITLRHALPTQRNTAFDPRPILQTVCDADSLLELRQGFGPGVVTAVARLGGRPVALAASDCRHLGGALDGPACDKLVRFLRLADAQGWPVITFVDTPGFMVGPDSERTGLVRRAGDLFIAAARLRVPWFSVMLRRGFGLGAMALAGGHFHKPRATCAWPAAEFGPMGLEGAVRLGFRKELEAQPEGPQREALFQRLLSEAVQRGQAMNMASHLEIDDVIDPAETRDWLLRQLAVAGVARVG